MSLSLSDPSLLKSQAYINGEWVDADNGATFPVTNPANGELITEVAKLGAAETARAIAAADAAMQSWKKLPAKARAGILRKWYDLMMANQEDLAQIMTAEQGKVLAESRGEIAYGAAFVEWFGEEAKRIDGDVIPGPSSDKRIVCIKQPVGVVAAITPWNFPNAMIARKAAPALAAGCSIVIKPATETPLSAFAMVELAERAGIPAGVINVIAGSSSDIGGELTSNPTVRKVTFTGSTPVGKMLTAACADTMKKRAKEIIGFTIFVALHLFLQCAAEADLTLVTTGTEAVVEIEDLGITLTHPESYDVVGAFESEEIYMSVEAGNINDAVAAGSVKLLSYGSEFRIPSQLELGAFLLIIAKSDLGLHDRAMKALVPVPVAADLNDFAGPKVSTGWRFSLDAPRALSGITPPTPAESGIFALMNASDHPLTISHDSADSALGSRFKCPGNTAFTLKANSVITVWYDIFRQCWMIMG